jgi:hypothetical protein
MRETVIDVPRLLAGGLAAGAWVFVSGILMAAVFGYREMSTEGGLEGVELERGGIRDRRLDGQAGVQRVRRNPLTVPSVPAPRPPCAARRRRGPAAAAP